MYPIMLDLTGKPCVVIGGGKIAYRRILTLLKVGANITVISPTVCAEIEVLGRENEVRIFYRDVMEEDYLDAFLIIAATNSVDVNAEIAANIQPYQLINVVNKHELGNFHIPASISRGKLIISVSTSGASPFLAKKIRDEIKDNYDETYESYLDFLTECRNRIKENNEDQEYKKSLLKELLDDKYRYSTEEQNKFLKRLNH